MYADKKCFALTTLKSLQQGVARNGTLSFESSDQIQKQAHLVLQQAYLVL